MKIQVRGILFDMDGVLVSSLGSVERSWTKWGEMHGMDAATVIHEAHGQRAIETVRKLRPDLDADVETAIIENLEVEDTDDLKVLDGVEALLKLLPQKNWTIVTSATNRLARARLGHAGIAVPERFINADMVEHGKPHPEPYLRGAKLLGFAPEDCLVIEDSASGARAGHAAGCKVLTTLFSHTVEELLAADWIVPTLTDVKFSVGDDGIELEFEPLPREVAVLSAEK
jgi:mannitol-1-/sugar-/sorbitol-6-phosphatase